MSKTLETKNRILDLLKERKMTITDLSKELDLSSATISQHLDELQKVGAVEKLDSEYFKKLKYYTVREPAIPLVARYIVGAIVVFAVAASLVYFYSGGNARMAATNLKTPSMTNTTTVAPSGGSGPFAVACIRTSYQLNGSVKNYSGFAAYQLNSSNGNVTDYVIGRGSTGTLHVTEYLYNVVAQTNSSPIQSEHHATLIQEGKVFNTSSPGVNMGIDPRNFSASMNETLELNVTINTNSTAIGQTYWLRVDGPCGGSVDPVLITVGSAPYNGTVSVAVIPYA